jgi:hypothetical protein
MAISADERADLTAACQIADTMREYDVRPGGVNRIRIDGSGHVVITLRSAAHMDEWARLCDRFRGSNTLTTNTAKRTLTFKPA